MLLTTPSRKERSLARCGSFSRTRSRAALLIAGGIALAAAIAIVLYIVVGLDSSWAERHAVESPRSAPTLGVGPA
jgi:hypothetical protein